MGKKGDATRSAIFKSALELFTTIDYERVSIRVIARHAGVTAPHIYKHFKDKDELVQILFDEVITDLYNGLVACTSNISSTHVKIYRMTEYYLGIFQANRNITNLIYGRNTLSDWRKSKVNYARAKRLGDILKRVLIEGQIIGDVRKDISINLLNQLYHGGLRQLVIVWLYNECKFNLLTSAGLYSDAVYAAVSPVPTPYVCPFADKQIPIK